MKMETRKRAIDKVYKRRDRIDMPDFQREEVWPDTKKKLLIDSILRGWHLPKFYFRKLDDGTFECVDGQQRLSAIFEFFDNELTLNDNTQKRVKASKYSELDDDLSDDFDDFEIEIGEIEDATDEDLEELFKRLQLGTPLNTAEKINAISGEARDFCHSMAEKEFIGQKIALKNTRYSHFDTIVKWAFIEARGIHSQMRLPQLESFLKENRTFSSSSETATKIIGALDFLNSAFPESCPMLRNRANTLSILMLAARVYSQNISGETAAELFGGFVTGFFRKLSAEVEKGVKAIDKELLRYQNAISSGSTGGDSIRTRINILTKRLAAYSPIYATLLGAFPQAQDETIRNIEELAKIARDLVYDINRAYSAANGKDLFKMTTESSAALNSFSNPIREAQTYGKFIDGLYFLIYEGSGNCKRLPQPPPEFSMDVKFLRNNIRHDVDHGGEKDYAKKKRRAAGVFEKYSGKKSIEECGPEEMLTIQIRILETLVEFLEDMKKG